MIVRLKASSPHYPELSASQPYFVIGIEANDFRILNDKGKPYLYPPDLFDVIDAQHSPDWVTEFGADGEEYSYPASLNVSGFFEDFLIKRLNKLQHFGMC